MSIGKATCANKSMMLLFNPFLCTRSISQRFIACRLNDLLITEVVCCLLTQWGVKDLTGQNPDYFDILQFFNFAVWVESSFTYFYFWNIIVLNLTFSPCTIITLFKHVLEKYIKIIHLTENYDILLKSRMFVNYK